MLSELYALSELDLAFADLLRRRFGEDDPLVLGAAALACLAPTQGHLCVHLGEIHRHYTQVQGKDPVNWPQAEVWAQACLSSQAVRTPEQDRVTPLVLDGLRLYLDRTWTHETTIVRALRSRAHVLAGDLGEADIDQAIEAVFPGKPGEEGQRAAVRVALTRRLAIITGGPGTGKTSVVVRLLAILRHLQVAAGRGVPRVRLVAPTGKAADRLEETVRDRLGSTEWVPLSHQGPLPVKGSTIHRALGVKDFAQRVFWHDADHQLPADVVVLDEASMVDAGLMARLLAAVSPSARLILLGDPDQLQSVDYGAVLGDVCAAAAGGPLQACHTHLHHVFRYEGDSDIDHLARAIQAQEAERVVELLDGPRWFHVERREPGSKRAGALKPILQDRAVAAFKAVVQAPDESAALKALRRLRVLCAVRRGPRGVDTVNALIERWLEEAGVIDPSTEWYEGRPIMIRKNDKALGLFNGNVGVIRGGKAWFDLGGDVPRSFQPGLLPEHETVYATTVHKSQGSEYADVVVVLPHEDEAFLTRELLYTGVTRASGSVVVVGSAEVVKEAVKRRAERMSGVRGRLGPS